MSTQIYEPLRNNEYTWQGCMSSIYLTNDEFLNGYTFFAWNLTADYDGQPQNTARRENIRLDVKFSEVTKASINILLYAVFDSTVMINGSGEVLTDYKD